MNSQMCSFVAQEARIIFIQTKVNYLFTAREVQSYLLLWHLGELILFRIFREGIKSE